MRKFVRIFISVLMTVLMCFSLLSPFAIALSGNVENVDTTINAPEHDISVMSFNILERNTGGTTYSAPRTRAPYVVATIKKYMPDIIGIQEAADATANNDNLDWNAYLETELGKLGYKHRQLSQESAKPSSQGGMTIGAGLMIFYKSDRFELRDHNSVQYGGANGVTGSYQGYTSNDKSRFYHWVKLWDKEKETFVYTFNTHLSINPSGISGASNDVHKQIGHHRRTQEINELIAHIESVSTEYPCFATGDYNTHWNDSVEDSTTQNLLYGMTENGIMSDSGLDSPRQITHSGRMSNIDHVFYNKTVSTSLQTHHVFEDFGGIQPSDHKAVISYFNYGTTQTFTSGNYDPVNRTFSDITDESTYTLPLAELPEYISYRIFNQSGTQVAQPLQLTSDVNRFALRFYNRNNPDVVFGETNVIIRTSAAQLPTVTATNTENVYYANNAYHVLLKDGQSSTSVTVENGKLQNLNNQNIQGNLTSLSEAVSTYRVKSTAGDVYPLYIYKPTLTAESGKHLYIDDDIGDANGTVAFKNEDGVIYLTAGANGFGTVTAAAAVANTADGHTLHIAPGLYKENTVTFNKNVTILGNNADISPLNITDNVWSRSDSRREESQIQIDFIFSKNGDQTTTVKGLHFIGSHKYSTLYYTGSNLQTTVTVDISNNIFETTSSDMGSASCIYLYIGTQKKGRISDNYMRSPEENAASTYRILTLRNANGLTFERNYCIGYTGTAFHSTSELASNNTSAGYANLIVQNNRFENCANIQGYIRNVKDSTTAHYQFLYNDFVRCGYPNTHALYFNFDETSKSPTTFRNTALTVFGNRFVDCSRGMTITRTANLQGDMRDMKINIQQNRFIDCNQFRVINSLYFYCYGAKDKTQNVYSENWDCSHNYFCCEEVSGNDPIYYVNNKINSSTYSLDISKLCYPYYTNSDLTWLSDSSTAAKQSGISITDNRHEYDGQPHSLTIVAPEDAVISYSLDSSNARVYNAEKPTLTNPGTLTVYYQVERPGYQNFTGRALISITLPKRTLTIENVTVPYDGKPHTVNPILSQSVPGDEISYTVNGEATDRIPNFTESGIYKITMTVVNSLYTSPLTAEATLTITAGEFTDVELSLTDGITLSGVPTGTTVHYAVDGGTPTTQKPTLTGSEQSITVTLTRAGYNELTLVAFPDKTEHPFTLRISKASENNELVWRMTLVADRNAMLKQNVTLLSYGYLTAETATAVPQGTYTPVNENETGILIFEDEIVFSASASSPTAACVIYNKDGKLITLCGTVGAK